MNRKTKGKSKAIVHDMRDFDPNGPDSWEDALARLRRGEIVKACHLPRGRARGSSVCRIEGSAYADRQAVEAQAHGVGGGSQIRRCPGVMSLWAPSCQL
jgi:hypothetical protein